MRSRTLYLALVWLLPLLSSGPLRAQNKGSAGTLDVFLRLPAYEMAVFGDVPVTADFYPPDADIEFVEFQIDGRLAATVTTPPWSAVLYAGEENVEHRYVVRVHERGGRVAATSITTPALESHEMVDVALQQLYVAVETPQHERVLDLGRSDFTIFDNGKRQELTTFENGDVPFSAVVLVDASYSMQGGRLEVALRGAEAFLDGMRPLDQAKLVLHSDQLLRETPFSATAADLVTELSGVEAGGGTALNDHLYLALKRLESVQGRRVVILLSDGIDVESILPMAYVRWLVRQLQPVIYWIRLVDDRDASDDPTVGDRRSYWRGVGGHRTEIRELVETVEESGGRIDTIRHVSDVEASFRWILDDLRNQYVLGYVPKSRAGADGRHEVDVRTKRRGVRVRTRASYLDSPRWTGGKP